MLLSSRPACPGETCPNPHQRIPPELEPSAAPECLFSAFAAWARNVTDRSRLLDIRNVQAARMSQTLTGMTNLPKIRAITVLRVLRPLVAPGNAAELSADRTRNLFTNNRLRSDRCRGIEHGFAGFGWRILPSSGPTEPAWINWCLCSCRHPDQRAPLEPVSSADYARERFAESGSAISATRFSEMWGPALRGPSTDRSQGSLVAIHTALRSPDLVRRNFRTGLRVPKAAEA